jgi:hypothetical protein
MQVSGNSPKQAQLDERSRVAPFLHPPHPGHTGPLLSSGNTGSSRHLGLGLDQPACHTSHRSCSQVRDPAFASRAQGFRGAQAGFMVGVQGSWCDSRVQVSLELRSCSQVGPVDGEEVGDKW